MFARHRSCNKWMKHLIYIHHIFPITILLHLEHTQFVLINNFKKLVSLQYIYFFNSFAFLEFNIGQRFEYWYPLTVIEKQLSTWRIILSLNVGFMVQLIWSRVYCLWISTKMKDKPIVQLDNYFCRDNNFNTHNNDQKQYFNHLFS